MNLSDSLVLMEKYAQCPKCKSDKVGNGAGTLEVEDDTFKRTCKCGWAVLVKKGLVREDITMIEKALQVFPKSYVYRNEELILEPRNNVYFRLVDVETEIDFKCKMFAWVSRPIAKSLNKYWAPRVLKSFNTLMDTNFTKSDMYLIYDRLGNDVNRKLTIRFIESGYDMELLKR
ncbi:DUF3797 domain-containing protein [Paenibacillus amylolyticus]|nr:DUF3797 domain-containing protein [Paenibacillus amylolyticus]